MPFPKACLPLCAALVLWNCEPASTPESHAQAWKNSVAGLDAALARLQALALSPDTAAVTDSALQAAFHDARLVFKRSEYLWEYAFPISVARLNGPALDEVERDCDHSVIKAEGFQVLEEGLHPRRSISLAEAADRVEAMRATLAEVSRAEVMEPPGTSLVHRPLLWTDSCLLDAMRLEIVRLAFLALSGFDSPIARQSLPETRAALEGMAGRLDALSPRGGDARRAHAALRAALEAAAAGAEGDFAAFDRLAYMADRLNPAYAALAAFQKAQGVPLPRDVRPFSPASADLFSADAWNPGAFGPHMAWTSSPAQVELGRKLFFDPVLSGAGDRSCATCHDPARGFGDGRRKSLAVGGKQEVGRNAPSLLLAGFQRGAFWDLRAESLEDQVDGVIHNPREMGGSLEKAAAAMQNDPDYPPRFLAAFASDSHAVDKDAPVTPLRIRRALAAYMRSLASFDSPWDRYMRGDKHALTEEARRGFNVFMGKAACGTCHFPPLFNGSVPPLYLQTDLEVLGVPAGPGLAHPKEDGDSGRMAYDNVPLSRGAFKTPTVRNTAFTAPYMHNGAFATLEEVMEFYDVGGGAGLGLRVPNQTLSADSLHLTEDEERSLIAFIHALSDTAGATARPSGARDYATVPGD